MVIHNWVDTYMFSPKPELRKLGRETWCLPEAKFNFLLVGSLYYPKGFHIAIRSFGELLKNNIDANLLIAGSGNRKNEQLLRKIAISSGLAIGENIRFLGEIPHSDLPLLYNAADVFLMPSLFIEVLPYTLIEAMSCGLPCIVSKLGGNIEAAGETGIMVPAGDDKSMTKAMIDLVQNKQKRINLGHHSRKRVEEFFSDRAAYNKIKGLLNRRIL